jgi:ADP-ribose pyrophosphatase
VQIVSELPDPPEIAIEVAKDHGAATPRGFLDVHRYDLALTFPDGTRSEAFTYDVCERRAVDAVVIVCHFRVAGARHVILRSSVRPPLGLRYGRGGLWELPAGLIDPGEADAEAASREAMEEIGLAVPASRFQSLGPDTFPVPAVIAERHVYLHAEVDPDTCTAPTEDGSPLERMARVVAMRADLVLEACRSGRVRDAKTELAVRRLLESELT